MLLEIDDDKMDLQIGSILCPKTLEILEGGKH
jgi:hypothetical protein